MFKKSKPEWINLAEFYFQHKDVVWMKCKKMPNAEWELEIYLDSSRSHTKISFTFDDENELKKTINIITRE